MAKVKKLRKKKKTSTPYSENLKKSAELSLPTEDNEPPDNLEDSVILIYGRKAIGKTTLANKFDNPLTFMFERARRNLKIRQVPQFNPKSKKRPVLTWEDFLEYVELFLESDYQTAVIDTIDRCYLTCFDYVCHNAGVKDPNEMKDGYKLWRDIEAEYNAILSMLQESGKGLVFLSHEKVELINTKVKSLRRAGAEDEQIMGRWEPSCKPAARKLIQEICDYVFYYCFIENKRCMYVRSPDEIAWCACGLDNFLDPDGNQINKFELGNTPDKAYESLLSAYNNEQRDLDYVKPLKKRRKKKLD